MKLYYSFFAALACYGCASQQPKEVPSPPEDNSAAVDSRQLNKTIEPDSKDAEMSAPQTTLKMSPETNVKKDKVITKQIKKDKVITSQVKKDQVIKSRPEKSKKLAAGPEQTVKSDSRQSGAVIQTEAKVTQTISPQANSTTSTEKQEIKNTSIKSDSVDLKKSDKAESGQPSSTNLTDSQVAQIIIPQTTLETDSENQEIEDTLAESNTIDFDLENLPVSFGDTWFLDRNHDSVSKTTRCLLISQKQNFFDGYTDSTISLQLSKNTLLIKTNSTIDLSYPDIGIYIDQNTPFPLEKLFGDSSILIRQNTQDITSQLLDGQKLTIKLGFWPTWPQTQTHSIDFALADFDKAYQSFQACEKL